jgi:HlyD family secretion protein
VWVLRNAKPESVPIRSGVSDGSLTEVVEGDLSQGDLVITDATVGGSTAQQPASFPRPRF